MRATLRRLWHRQEVKAAVYVAVPAIIGAALGIKLALPDGIWPDPPGQPVASSSSRKEPPSTRPTPSTTPPTTTNQTTTSSQASEQPMETRQP